MAILFHPEAGTILICDYGHTGVSPEMVKKRPVIVVSPKFKRKTGLYAVVPLSTSEPHPIEPWHVQITLAEPVNAHFSEQQMWAKCDVVSSVSYQRLHLVNGGRDHTGRRTYRNICLSKRQLYTVKEAVAQALGIFAC